MANFLNELNRLTGTPVPYADEEAIVDTTNFRVENRTIVQPPTAIDLVVQEDTNSRILTFEMDRYFDAVDLSSKTIQIDFKLPADEDNNRPTGNQPITNLNVDDNTFSFDWLIESAATTQSGELEVAIDITTIDAQNEVVYRWQTKPMVINVLENIKVINDAIAHNYDTEKAFYEHYHKLATLEIQDQDRPYNIVNRTINVEFTEDIVVSLDNNSQIVSFTMNKNFDGVDLSTKAIGIKYINAAGHSGRTMAVNIVVEGETLKFGWLIDSRVTELDGPVAFAIEFIGYVHQESGEPLFYYWQTKASSIEVSKGLMIEEDHIEEEPSFYRSWLIQASNNLKSMMITLRVENGILQWKHLNDEGWSDLINLSNLTHNAITLRGTLGTRGTIQELPEIHDLGWAYQVVTPGIYAGHKCEAKDIIVSTKTKSEEAGTTNLEFGTTGPGESDYINFRIDSLPINDKNEILTNRDGTLSFKIYTKQLDPDGENMYYYGNNDNYRIIVRNPLGAPNLENVTIISNNYDASQGNTLHGDQVHPIENPTREYDIVLKLNGATGYLSSTFETVYQKRPTSISNWQDVITTSTTFEMELKKDGTAEDEWTVFQGNLEGAVFNSNMVQDNNIPIFLGTSGKQIGDSGFSKSTLKNEWETYADGKIKNEEDEVNKNTVGYSQEFIDNELLKKQNELSKKQDDLTIKRIGIDPNDNTLLEESTPIANLNDGIYILNESVDGKKLRFKIYNDSILNLVFRNNDIIIKQNNQYTFITNEGIFKFYYYNIVDGSGSSHSENLPKYKMIRLIDIKEKVLPIIKENITVSTWKEPSEFPDFPYYANIEINGITESMIPEVIFGAEESVSGNYLPLAEIRKLDDERVVVTIYSKEPKLITIPLIKCEVTDI